MVSFIFFNIWKLYHLFFIGIVTLAYADEKIERYCDIGNEDQDYVTFGSTQDK